MVQGQLTKSRQHSRRHVQWGERSPIQSKGVTVPLSNLPHSKRIKFFSGGVRGGSVHLLDSTEETPHYVRGDKKGKQRRLLAKSARSDTFWNEGFAPFPTFPQSRKVVFGRSWRRGLFPPPLMVISSVARNPLFYVFSGESLGGDVQPPQLNWRPLTTFGVTKKGGTEETPRKVGSEWHILERGLHPLSNFSPKAKMIFISGHPERSEGWPILGRGKRPLPN